MSGLGPILASLQNSSSMATVLADMAAQNHNLSEKLQKQLATEFKQSIKKVIAIQKAVEFVQSNPDHVLEHKLPGLYLGKCEGELSDSEQKNKCKRLIAVFNLLLKNDTLTQVHSDHIDTFKTYGFLTDPTNVEQALYTAYSLPNTRRMYLDACRYMCHVLNYTDPKWYKLANAYDRLMTKCTYMPVDRSHRGERDGKRTRQQYEDLSVADANAHIADMQYSAKTLKKFINPKLQTMLEAAKRQPSHTEKIYTKHLSTLHCLQGENKRLGTWCQMYIVLASKHGTSDSDELRSLRTGDWQRLSMGSSLTDVTEDSYLIQNGKQMTLHVLSTKIRFRVTIPLHERCKNLANFLRKKWIPIMKLYQKTDTPYILCTILSEPSKRGQMSTDAVQALNKRAMEAAGLDGTTNFSRHCDAKRTRTGPNRPEESAHGARQDVQYQNCTGEPPVEATDDEIEAPPPPFDWDQFRCPSDASSVTTESDFDAGAVELPSDDESD
eukprot:COSAG01_NODE_500_length_16223_cov_42.586988_2_plen_495_part_00